MLIMRNDSGRSGDILSKLVLTSLLLTSTLGFGFYVDGSGHFGLLGETRTAPAADGTRGMYQATRISARLLGEIRRNDRASFFLELRFAEDERRFLLGDTSDPQVCHPRRIDPESSDDTNGDNVHDTIGRVVYDSSCQGQPQDTSNPSYKSMLPRIAKAYIRYAMDYCIIEAGRRDRDWGMGIFLDSGREVFESSASVFDGITCHINIQKTQTLGFRIGYDKLSETGTYLDNPYTRVVSQGSRTNDEFDALIPDFGATNPRDDLDQYFFSIEFDDRRANTGALFTKQVGVYVANVVSSGGVADNSTSTDLKFVDLYTGLNVGRFRLKNEFLFRLGKTGDPNGFFLGGAREDDESIAVNNMQSIAVAGQMTYGLGAFQKRHRAVEKAGRGNLSDFGQYQHTFFVDYAYAPGDSGGHGYYRDRDATAGTDYETLNSSIGELRRDKRVEAIAFHRNYKPALILFNGNPGSDELRVDGAFDPTRLMNASLMSVGYSYFSDSFGQFDVRLITANLSTDMPADVRAYYEGVLAAGGKTVIGHFGRDLGVEIDLEYEASINDDMTYGFGLGYLVAGDAWKTSDSDPKNNTVLQGYVSMKL